MHAGIRRIVAPSGRTARSALAVVLVLSTLLVAPVAAGGQSVERRSSTTWPAVVGTDRGPWLDAAEQRSCLLRPDGSIHCWGNDLYGLATGRPGPYTAVALGRNDNCGLQPGGSLHCWSDHSRPLSSHPGPFTAVAVGWEHACGLQRDGAAHCWGNHNFGQRSQPGPYTAIAEGEHHDCAIRPDGSVDCWGWNESGQAEDQAGTYTALTASRDHTCALRADGAARCWGSNDFGQSDDQPGPYTAISAGRARTCALRTDGSLHCWGAPWSGFGMPADESGRYLDLALGLAHGCGLRLDGSVDCWGSNDYGSALDQPGPFVDVVDHPFGADIYWLAAAEITRGYDDGGFHPTAPVSRMAMASFLWRYDGRPGTLESEPLFADVGVGHPFYDAIQWMGSSGLSTGSPNPAGGKPLFKPAEPVSRQAMAAFLWRFAEEPATSLSEPYFQDVTGPPFLAAIQWMAESGLSTGTADPGGGRPHYKPTDAVSRQAMAAFLHRFDDR